MRLYIIIFILLAIIACSREQNLSVCEEKEYPNDIEVTEITSRLIKTIELEEYMSYSSFDYFIVDNKIIYYSKAENFIKIIDTSDEHITTINKMGKGPGEIGQINSVFYDLECKCIVVVDAKNFRYSYFSMEAAFIKIEKFSDLEDKYIYKYLSEYYKLKRDKIVLVEQSMQLQDNILKNHSSLILKKENEKKVLYDFSFEYDKYSPEMGFVKEAVDLEKEIIFIVDFKLDKYFLNIFNSEGQYLYKVTKYLTKKKKEVSRSSVVKDEIAFADKNKIQWNFDKDLMFYREAVRNLSIDSERIYLNSWDDISTCIHVYNYSGNFVGKIRKSVGEWDFCTIFENKIYEFYFDDENEKVYINIYDFKHKKADEDF